MSQPDFLDSHQRHLTDAEHLYALQRYANADHLYGLSAECGLKRLMQAFGMPLDSDGLPPGPDKKHINKLWPRYEAYRSGMVPGTRFGLAQDPFTDWQIEQRYEHQGRFTTAVVDPHRQGAADIATLIRDARAAGYSL
ncbi:MAG TPA: SAM-dependent methyltransferase [Myxococcota bacterium]|nr:SAM-dependent methyltransferase [Myxococcota bacterium]